MGDPCATPSAMPRASWPRIDVARRWARASTPTRRQARTAPQHRRTRGPFLTRARSLHPRRPARAASDVRHAEPARGAPATSLHPHVRSPCGSHDTRAAPQEMEEGDLRTVALNRNPSVHGAQQTGIGIVFGRPEVGPEASGPYKIHSVSSGGTAFQSGLICAGDMLFKVNGVSVLDLTAEQITALILGKPSSPITLTISTPPALHASQPQLPHTSSVHSLAPTPALHSTTPHQLHSTPPANVPMTDDDIGNRPVSPSVAHSYRSTRNTSLWNRSAHGTPVSELRGYMSSSPSLANTSVAGHPSASDSSAPPLYTGYQSHTSATRGMAPISAMSVSRAHTHETPPDTGPPLPPLPVSFPSFLHRLSDMKFRTTIASVACLQDIHAQFCRRRRCLSPYPRSLRTALLHTNRSQN